MLGSRDSIIPLHVAFRLFTLRGPLPSFNFNVHPSSCRMSANPTSNEDRPVNIEMTMSESVSGQPSDGAKSLSTLKKQDYLLGIGLLLVVVFLWTSSNFITQVRAYRPVLRP